MFFERAFVLLNILTVLLVIAAGLTILKVLCILGRILRRIKGRYHVLITDEGPEIHTGLPEFEGQTPEGGLFRSSDLAGREFVVILVSPECSPCHSLLSTAESVRRKRFEPPTFVIVAEGTVEIARQYRGRYRIMGSILADPGGSIRSQLGVLRSPYGFLVDGSGIIRMKGVLSQGDHLEALLARRGRSVGTLPWDSANPTESPALQ